jgi:uncharacterized protein (DUF302 family)
MSYYSRKLKLPFDEVVAKLTDNLQQQGFGVITKIDIKDIFKQKLNVNFRNYQILGACNPNFAFKAISIESHIGVFLPCNILVQEHENGEVEVSAIAPLEMIEKSMATTQLVEFANEVGNKLRVAVDDLKRATADHGHPEALPLEFNPENREAIIQG